MKYKLSIDGDEAFEVDMIQIGIPGGPNFEGWADLYISVTDTDLDIYEDPGKNAVWIDWLNDCFDPGLSEEKRVKSVVATIESDGGKPYRTATITKAFIASYSESSDASGHSYSVTIRREPDLRPPSSGGEAETIIA